MSIASEPAGTLDTAGDHVVAVTAAGSLRGSRFDGVDRFLGVPYAEPPVGALRFRAPHALDPWDGVRTALSLGSPSVQNSPDLPAWVDPSEESENCLFLNVWSPVDRDLPLPVMVWLHGGGFTYGSGGAPVYDGANLAEQGDVVVVSINHRLGAFGYTWFGDLIPELAEHANPGQLDLELALRWVRDNIAGFGGDPSNVTVFGQSGGGGKISTLSVSPSAVGLFDKMIMQSPAPDLLHDRAAGTEIAGLLLSELGLEHPTEADLLRLSSGQLKRAAVAVEAARGILAFRPVVDGRHVPHQLGTEDALAPAGDIPLLIGTTAEEMVPTGPTLGAGQPDDDVLVQQLGAFPVAPALDEHEWSDLVVAYRRLMPGAATDRLAMALMSDVTFWATARDIVGGREGSSAATFAFEFAWPTPCFGSTWAVHGGELSLVFGNLFHASAWDGQDSDELREAADPDGQRFVLSDVMIAAWSSFAHTGDPSTSDVAWEPWSTAGQATMVLGDGEPRVAHDWKVGQWAAVKDLPRPW